MKKFTVTFEVPAEVTMVVEADDISQAIRKCKVEPWGVDYEVTEVQWNAMKCVGAEPDETPEC